MNDYLGFLGPQGTFTEETALMYCRDNPGTIMKEYISIAEIIEDVSGGKVRQGIVPLENSLEGSVSTTLDLLASETDVFIKKEIIYPITHCLMAPKGSDIKEIKEVYSHMQAFSQCRKFLKEKLSEALLIPVSSTGAAAKMVAHSGEHKAAIAPARAAKLFELDIIFKGIEDGNNGEKSGNVTRFIIIANDDHPLTGKDKTSVILSINDGPGSLYNILGIFAAAKINLTKIESRPARKNLGEYLFFIDFEGHRQTDNVSGILKELEDRVKFIKMLGSYPSYNLE